MGKRGLVISGGKVELPFLKEIYQKETFDLCIVADHGIESAHALQIVPDYLVGDFDSTDSTVLEEYKSKINEQRIHTVFIPFQPEKDMTDTEIAIDLARKEGVTDLILVGATGSRFDHVCGNIQLLYKLLKYKIDAYIIDVNNKIYLRNQSFQVKKCAQYGNYISLLPFSEQVTAVSLEGFRYPLHNRTLVQGETIGISNEIVENTACVTLGDGVLLVVESRD